MKYDPLLPHPTPFRIETYTDYPVYNLDCCLIPFSFRRRVKDEVIIELRFITSIRHQELSCFDLTRKMQRAREISQALTIHLYQVVFLKIKAKSKHSSGKVIVESGINSPYIQRKKICFISGIDNSYIYVVIS